MIAAKVQEILLENNCRNLTTIIGNYWESTTVLVIQSDQQREEARLCWCCHKPGYKKDFY